MAKLITHKPHNISLSENHKRKEKENNKDPRNGTPPNLGIKGQSSDSKISKPLKRES